MANSQGYLVSQSMWALDAAEDFITAPIYTASQNSMGSPGELQNNYSQCFGSEARASDWQLSCSVEGAESYPAFPGDPLNFGARLSNYYLSTSPPYDQYATEFAEYAVGSSATGSSPASYSISAWIRPQTYAGSLPALHQSKKYNIVSFMSSDHPRPSTPTAGTCSVQLFLTGNAPTADSWSVGMRTIIYHPYMSSEIYDDATSSVMVDANEWTHLLFCYDARTPDVESLQTDRAKLYINGNLVDILTSSVNQTGKQSPFWGKINVTTGAIGNDASYNTDISTLTGGAAPAGPDSYFINNVFHGGIADVGLFNYSLHTYDDQLPAIMYNDGCSPYLPSFPVFNDETLRPTAFYQMGGCPANLPGPVSPTPGPPDTAGSDSWDPITGNFLTRLQNAVPFLWESATGSIYSKGDGYPVRDSADSLAGIADVRMALANPGPCPAGYDAPTKEDLIASPIYNRKHSLGSIWSVTHFGWAPPKSDKPSSENYTDRTLSMPIPEVSSAYGVWLGSFPAPSPYGAQARAFYSAPLGSISTCGGSAEWESGRLAGQTSNNTWESAPQVPSYDSYNDYNQDMRLKNQDYSIIPEFLISDQISFYFNKQKGDFLSKNPSQFAIKGTSTSSASNTPSNSSDDSFYETFSNSDFLRNFSVIKQDHKGFADPSTITLKCKALMKFLPYDGFFPSERSLQIANQFSKSYGDHIEYYGLDKGLASAKMRPFLTPFFRPGIMYNTIKSGLAVDFPIYSSSYQIINYLGTPRQGPMARRYTDYYALGTQQAYSSKNTSFTASWDLRVPFEAIVEPEKHLAGVIIYDMEPSPHSYLDIQAKWAGHGDILYKRMMHNYLAAIPEFFLPNGEFTNLTSKPETEYLTVQSGTSYGMRVKIRRSMNKPRAWVTYGEDKSVVDYDIPQDPRNLSGDASGLRETFTMYSRPSAFGPPVAGTTYLGFSSAKTCQRPENVSYNTDLFPSDSLMGINPSFTPPYYGRESWADVVWKAESDGKVTMNEIFSKASINYWAIDTNPILSGVTSSVAGTLYGSSRQQAIWSTCEDASNNRLEYSSPMNTSYANAYAMQLDASLNILGKKGDRWVIEPKFETPHYNFNSETSIRPITSADNTLAIPTHGSESVPRGMWHQFGTMESDKGIYIEAAAIPDTWRMTRGYADPNRPRSSGEAPGDPFNTELISNIDLSIYQNDNFEDLSKLVGFEEGKKLGNTAASLTVSEAIVAVPFTIENGKKKFFEIPENVIRKALGDLNTIESDKAVSQATLSVKAALVGIDKNKAAFSDDQDLKGAKIQAAAAAAASASTAQLGRDEKTSEKISDTIRDMVSKMKKFVFPPNMDFVNNLGKITPYSAYIFEFEYQFTQTDLAYMWQNVAPPKRKGKFISKDVQISHHLFDNELMGSFGLKDNDPIKDGVQWMVFKVKQRANNNYFSKVSKESGPKTEQFPVSYNWPYDFFSLVEYVNMDAKIGFGRGIEEGTVDQRAAEIRQDPLEVAKRKKRNK